MRARPELSGLSCSFEQALWYAQWWTRMALDVAPDYKVHAGAAGHLRAADVQLTAVENLERGRAA